MGLGQGHAAAIVTSVADREMKRARTMGAAADRDRRMERTHPVKHAQPGHKVAQHAPPPLGIACQRARQVHTQTDTGDVEKRDPVDLADIDPPADSVSDYPGGGIQVLGNFERSRQIVRRAEQKNPERKSGIAQAGESRAQGSVASADHDAVACRAYVADTVREVRAALAVAPHDRNTMPRQRLGGTLTRGRAAPAFPVDDQQRAFRVSTFRRCISQNGPTPSCL